MADAVPAVPGARVVRALERAGFSLVRIRGSYHLMRHPGGRSVVAPVHAGRDVPRGTPGNVLSIVGITVGELRELL